MKTYEFLALVGLILAAPHFSADMGIGMGILTTIAGILSLVTEKK